jgi:hypothetical protein
MRWAKHYRKKDSVASRALKRLDRPKKAKAVASAVAKPPMKAPRRDPNAIPAEKHFFLCDGSSLGSIEALALRLDSMPDEHFRFHVNDGRNDFASWIKDVFAEHELAEQIAGVHDRKDFQITLLKHLIVKR